MQLISRASKKIFPVHFEEAEEIFDLLMPFASADNSFLIARTSEHAGMLRAKDASSHDKRVMK